MQTVCTFQVLCTLGAQLRIAFRSSRRFRSSSEGVDDKSASTIGWRADCATRLHKRPRDAPEDAITRLPNGTWKSAFSSLPLSSLYVRLPYNNLLRWSRLVSATSAISAVPSHH